jgi:hypothetical protein
MFSYIALQYLFYPQQQAVKYISKNAGTIWVPDVAGYILSLAMGLGLFIILTITAAVHLPPAPFHAECAGSL